MAKNLNTSETALLEQAQTALTNAQTQPQIAQEIAKYGYGEEKIAEGQNVYDQAWAAWQTNQKEDKETRQAYQTFSEYYTQLQTLYGEHRQKAKARFRSQPQTLAKLYVTGSKPTTYLNLMENITQFYIALANPDNAEIKTQLLTYNLPETELEQARKLLNQTTAARKEYVREESESQNATQQKDAALATLENWIRDFYAMANVALKKQPQLLEALGLFRKS